MLSLNKLSDLVPLKSIQVKEVIVLADITIAEVAKTIIGCAIGIYWMLIVIFLTIWISVELDDDLANLTLILAVLPLFIFYKVTSSIYKKEKEVIQKN